MPAMAMPNLAPENDWRDFKANLRPRMVVDGGAEVGAGASGWHLWGPLLQTPGFT